MQDGYSFFAIPPIEKQSLVPSPGIWAGPSDLLDQQNAAKVMF